MKNTKVLHEGLILLFLLAVSILPASAALNVQFFGAVDHLALTPTKTSVFANNMDTLNVKVQLKDAADNSVTTQGLSITLTSDNASLFTVTSTNPNTTDANGAAIFVVQATTGSGSTTLRAVATGGSFGVSPTIQAKQAPNAANSLASNNSVNGQIPAGTNVTITALVRDYDNAIIVGANMLSNVTFSITTGDATFANNNAKLFSANTNSNGMAIAQITSSNASVLNNISVNVTTLNETGGVIQIAPLQNFTVSEHVPPGASSVSAATSTLVNNTAYAFRVANNSDKFQLVLTVKDANGNVLSAQSFTAASNRSGDTVTPSAGSTNATGQALINVTSTLAGIANITVTFSDGVAVSNTNVPFVSGPAFQLAFSGPNSATAAAPGVPASLNNTIVVQDAFGNNITNNSLPTSFLLVTLTKSSVNANFPANANTINITNGSISNITLNGVNVFGVFSAANASFVLNDSVNETVTINAIAPPNFGTIISKTVQFFVAGGVPTPTPTPPPWLIHHLALTPTKSSLFANNMDTLNVTVQLKNATNDNISTPGLSVVLTPDNTSLLTVISTNPTTSDANGAATFTVSSTTRSGSTTLRAVAAGGYFNVSPTITTKQAPNAANSLASNNSVNGQIPTGTTITITALVRDYDNAPIAGANMLSNVTFNITTGDATFANNNARVYTANTNSSGMAVAQITSSNATAANLISVKVTTLNETGGVIQIAPLQNFTVTVRAPATITVNASGGADYTKIQDAIDNASAGDTILVYSGTYYENVKVNKQLTLRGIGMPAVDARGSGSAITLSADGITLEGFTATGGGDFSEAGIKVTSNNNKVRDNNASNNSLHGIYLESSSYNTLSGNNATSNNNYGIFLSSSSNYNTLNGNNASSNGNGIHLYSSSNYNTLSGNNANSNNYIGISQLSSSNNTLSSNNASNNYIGISLYSSSNYSLIGNNAMNNHDGIHLQFSGNNTLIGNNASNNYNGIELYSSSNNVLIGNNASSNNGVSGIILDSSSNNKIYNNIFNNTNSFYFSGSNINTWNTTRQSSPNILGGNFWASPNGTGFSQTCPDGDNDGICDSSYTLDTNNIDYLPLKAPGGGRGLTVINSCTTISSPGVYVLNRSIINSEASSCINITSSDVAFDGAGYTIDGLDALGYGVYAYNYTDILTNITVRNLKVTDWGYGVYYRNITNGKVVNNAANSNDGWGGYFLESSNNIILTNNTANSNGEGIRLAYSNNNILANNTMIFGTTYGISIEVSNNNILINNTVNSNGYGIYAGIFVYSSSNNTLSSNTALNNSYGIRLESSRGNFIFNNYLNNTNNAYDNGNNIWNITKTAGENIIGGPYLGGNSWSDYAGKDINGDGLGDTFIPYNNGGNIASGGDYLPLTQVATFNISGYKINDTNGNGIWDSGEAGISGWNITLRNAATGAVIASNLTNAAGFYQFLNLAQGSYNVSEEDKTGWEHTNASFKVVTLTSDITNLNFTNKQIPITVTSPNGGELWQAGTTQTIHWNYAGNPGSFAKIELLKGGMVKSTITFITSMGKSGSGSYNWSIPATLTQGTDYKVKVTSTTNPKYNDTSDSSFTISAPPPPGITVTSPNGGELWQAGTTQTIHWDYAGNPGSFAKIELLKGNMVSTITFITSIGKSGSGSYNWSIPAALTQGTDYKVKVTSATNPKYNDTSDANFTIS